MENFKLPTSIMKVLGFFYNSESNTASIRVERISGDYVKREMVLFHLESDTKWIVHGTGGSRQTTLNPNIYFIDVRRELGGGEIHEGMILIGYPPSNLPEEG